MVSPTNGWNQILKKVNWENPLAKKWIGKNHLENKGNFRKKKRKAKKEIFEKKEKSQKVNFRKKKRKAKKWFSKKRKAKKWISTNENDSVKTQEQQWTSSENNHFDPLWLLTLLSSLYYQLHFKPDLHERRIGESGIPSANLETSGRGIRWRRSRKPGPTTTRTVLQSNLARPV